METFGLFQQFRKPWRQPVSLSPRVVLMDLHLPGIGDGVDAAKQIHET
jgi:hypothetical protein